jgi:hypothetical protein
VSAQNQEHNLPTRPGVTKLFVILYFLCGRTNECCLYNLLNGGNYSTGFKVPVMVQNTGLCTEIQGGSYENMNV